MQPFGVRGALGPRGSLSTGPAGRKKLLWVQEGACFHSHFPAPLGYLKSPGSPAVISPPPTSQNLPPEWAMTTAFSGQGCQAGPCHSVTHLIGGYNCCAEQRPSRIAWGELVQWEAHGFGNEAYLSSNLCSPEYQLCGLEKLTQHRYAHISSTARWVKQLPPTSQSR